MGNKAVHAVHEAAAKGKTVCPVHGLAAQPDTPPSQNACRYCGGGAMINVGGHMIVARTCSHCKPNTNGKVLPENNGIILVQRSDGKAQWMTKADAARYQQQQRIAGRLDTTKSLVEEGLGVTSQLAEHNAALAQQRARQIVFTDASAGLSRKILTGAADEALATRLLTMGPKLTNAAGWALMGAEQTYGFYQTIHEKADPREALYNDGANLADQAQWAKFQRTIPGNILNPKGEIPEMPHTIPAWEKQRRARQAQEK